MVKEEKVKKVEELANLLNKHRVIGILNMYKTPASALQKIRSMLRDKAVIKICKKSMMLFALEKIGKKDLKKYVKDYPGLILTDTDPFRLYLFLQRNKTPIFAKPGDITEKDIEIKSGPTDLMPGPAISTLSKVKIPAKVEGGKISIIRDKLLCKSGDKMTEDVVAALQLLKIKPMEVTLNVVVVSEDGTIYEGEKLYIDEKKLFEDLLKAIQYGFNLSIESGWTTEQNINLLITKAFLNAKQVGLEAGIIKPKIVEGLLAKVKAEAEALKEKVG